jgi:hypothetical protein
MLKQKILLFFLVLCAGCQKKNDTFVFVFDDKEVAISLVKIQDSIFDNRSEMTYNKNVTVSTWRLNYPVYQFDCADITNDGLPEIAVGVIKSTRFDPIVRKRLFLFKLYDTCYVRPLWLGSRVSFPLVDFRLMNTRNGQRVRTIEQEADNQFVVAEYRYKTFGLEWIRYLKRGVTKKEAETLFLQYEN